MSELTDKEAEVQAVLRANTALMEENARLLSGRLVDRLAAAIACQEGWFDPGINTPKLLYNPGDLRFAEQTGAIKATRGFARWPTPQAGIVGLYRDLYAKIAAGMSLKTLIYVWAPPSENNSAVYLQNVQKRTGIQNVDTPLLTLIEPLQDPRVTP